MTRKSAKKSAVIENIEVKEVEEMKEVIETVETVEEIAEVIEPVVEVEVAETVEPVTETAEPVEVTEDEPNEETTETENGEIAKITAIDTATDESVIIADYTTEITETEPHEDETAERVEESDPVVKKERAKINTTPFPVAEIVHERLEALLPSIVAGLGDKENAQELAEAKLYNAGLQIVVDLVNKLQGKFLDYAPRSYDGKNPSAHWVLWKNTRDEAKKEQSQYKSKLAKIYAVTDTVCYELLNNENWAISKNAKYSIEHFLPNYTIKESCNVKEQVQALVENGVKTIDYIINYGTVSNTVLTELMSNGYLLTGIVEIEKRTFDGFGTFLAENGVYRFTKN